MGTLLLTSSTSLDQSRQESSMARSSIRLLHNVCKVESPRRQIPETGKMHKLLRTSCTLPSQLQL
jgi:hypothetical protein